MKGTALTFTSWGKPDQTGTRNEMTLKPVLPTLLTLFIAGTGFSQTERPAAPPLASPAPKVSEQLSRILDSVRPERATPPEQKEKAYAKLLEGQRYLWGGERLRSVAARQNNVKLAKQAFQESVAFDPMLSEGYTALAELAINGQPQDVDEAISLAGLSVKVNPNNFGARRILARLYTFQSRIVNGTFRPELGAKAIAEWKQVVRLDGRNAEGWAFLSELYGRTGTTDDQIDSLRKWLSSVAPVDNVRFYQMLMGGASLAPENASLKLGTVLLKVGRTKEAIETLSILVADDPDNFNAVELLREAVENAGPENAGIAVEALKQAVYANSSNVALINLLAQVQAKSGQLNEATKLLRDTAEKLIASDRASASMLHVTRGDLLARADRVADALEAYEAAFTARGLSDQSQPADDEREFAMLVFGKMIQLLKSSNRSTEAKPVIERARKMLGRDDLFADREMISLLRESGDRAGALAEIRQARTREPGDYGLIRLEATLLTETGKVDEAVALIKKIMETPTKPPTATNIPGGSESITIAVPAADEFSNYLFISNLYTQAGRGKEAADAANQAYSVARGAERKQIARLTLATAQQMAGDAKAAEATLRDLLKETPGNPIALNNLGYFLLDRDDRLEEALGLIQQAVKIDPTNPSYLDSLGWAYFRLGKLAEAESNLKEAVRIDSSSGTIHEHLGDVYQKQGKLDLARLSWNRAANLFSDAKDLARVKKKLADGK